MTNNDVKAFYKKVNRLGEELPWTTTQETEVHDSLKPEPRYEAVYLIKWAKLKNIPVSSHYRPIMSPERIKVNHLNRMLGMDIVTIDDSAAFLAVFNPHIENGEKYFKDMLLGAIHVRRITPINSSYRSDVPLDERDYKFTLSALMLLAKEKGLNIPIESLPTTDQKSKADNEQVLKDDEIHPNRLNAMFIMLLTMAVTKYDYDPKAKRNAATGENSGSIRADAQALGGKLNRNDLHLDINEGTVKAILDEAVAKLLK